MASKAKYTVIGVMSGTSLDGLDIACCSFERKGKEWVFDILRAETVKYSSSWKKLLAKAHELSGESLVEADISYGHLIGKAIVRFLLKHRLRVDFVASHGHTVFHQPAKGFTYQMGNGNAIHNTTGLPVVCDFRSLDVLRGGEGAPLVPAGDKFLFHEYDVCVNLGGIANLSMDIRRKRKAFDICFCNMALNYLSATRGAEFDRNGALAASGEIDRQLLKDLDRLYTKLRRKRPSLGREIFEAQFLPYIDNDGIPVENRLATCCESAAREIAKAIPADMKGAQVLCTGGGAFNSFLVSRMLEAADDRFMLVVPDDEIIKFKEAMVFGFLGVLRVRDEVNCLSSVTGAARDTSGGILIGF